MLTRVGSCILYFGVLGLIISLGWKQPLKYLFMPKEEVIAAKAATARPVPDASPSLRPEATPEPALDSVPDDQNQARVKELLRRLLEAPPPAPANP